MGYSMKSGYNEFIYHIKSGNIDGVKITFKLEYLEREDELGMRPIHYASQNGHIEIVKLLLDHKCNIDANNDYEVRIHRHECHKCHIESIKLLQQHKCNIEEIYEGVRPLHVACQTNHNELIKLLMQHKCNMDVSNKGLRPLHYACQEGHVKVVKLLLDHKCDIEDIYDDLVKSLKQINSQEILDLLIDRKNSKSMYKIARIMSLECNPGCSHKSCFISQSVGDLKRQRILIGSGSFAKVYKCFHQGRTFAMKVIRIQDDQKNIERDIEKYKNTLKNENIVHYFGAKTELHKLTIFMEYVSGESLYNRIKYHGSLPHQLIAKYSRQIIMATAFLHQKKIIHRDIKPTNILLDSGGEWLKLCDFGISRSLMTISTMKTQVVHTFCGTINYIAPEVVKDEPYSFPADIWSIGATMVEMLTGYPPFHSLNQFAVILKICQIHTIGFTSVEPMSDNLKTFVDQMLQSEPSKRSKAEDLLKCKFIDS